MTAKKRITLLSNASKAVIAAFKAEGHEIRFIDAPARPSPKTIRGPVVEPPRVQASPKVATITRTAPISAQTVSGPDRTSGAVAPVLNMPGTTAISTESPKGLFGKLRRHADRMAADPEYAARERLEAQGTFLPGGRSVRCHWQQWLKAAALDQNQTYAEVVEALGGEKLFKSRGKDGDEARRELCLFAHENAPHVKV